MNSEETQRQPATDLLKEIAAFVAEKDRLARRVDELLAANNATEEKRRIAVQELREARATVEAQGKMLVTLEVTLREQLTSPQQSVQPPREKSPFMSVMSECITRHLEFFPPDREPRSRAVQIIDAGIDLYQTLTDPMESISKALEVFEDRLGLQPATSGAVQR